MSVINFSDKIAVEKFVNACIKGERKEQQILYQSFYGKMLAVCIRYASNYEEARDILHDGFIKVFTSLNSFKNLGSLEGWIRKIIVNNAIDYIRKNGSYLLDYHEDTMSEIRDDSDEVLDYQEEINIKAEVVLDLIQKLTPAYKTVFNLYVIENYSHKEIAEKLNISVGASKSNLFKAKMKLKELLNIYIHEYK
ncbi:MAG: sigma-70 family RNA polymerase sigma factor [Bacteroidia bacterium]|nr:sigma-70 family RNA polymerase sigma factor [Bacteroidia bacterium]